jgi:transposase
VINAIRYVTRSGAQWRLVLHDLVPWGTAWCYFRRWREDGTWQHLHDAVRADVAVLLLDTLGPVHRLLVHSGGAGRERRLVNVGNTRHTQVSAANITACAD